MDLLFPLIDIVLHFDKYLPGIIETYGIWTYLILFLIIFCETGLVVLPYLPGDSLLFVAGALAGTGYLSPEILIGSLILAAVLGDTLNYWIGHTAGMKLFERNYCFIKKDHLEKTHEYFEKYGGFTIVIARFIPFIRTFAPFLAGVGKMPYRWFITYNLAGGILWICSFTLAGFFFGRIPVVQQNFGYIIYAIIGISLIAVVSVIIGVYRSMRTCPASVQETKDKTE
jgi:membrane-associated protein